jgi:hypothetical protein
MSSPSATAATMSSTATPAAARQCNVGHAHHSRRNQCHTNSKNAIAHGSPPFLTQQVVLYPFGDFLLHHSLHLKFYGT